MTTGLSCIKLQGRCNDSLTTQTEGFMAPNDLLLTLASYPDSTPVTVIEDAVSVASVLGAHIAALTCEVHVEVPGHFISGSAFGLPGVIAGEAGKSQRHARDLIAAFDAAAAKSGVSSESIVE